MSLATGQAHSTLPALLWYLPRTPCPVLPGLSLVTWVEAPDCPTTLRANGSWSCLAEPQAPTCPAPYHGRAVVVVLVAWLPGLEAAPAEPMVTSGTGHAVEDSSWSVGPTSGYRCPGAVHTDKVPSSQALAKDTLIWASQHSELKTWVEESKR